MAIFTSTLKPRLIYIFAIADEQHEGCLKIGETTFNAEATSSYPKPNSAELNKAAHARIQQYTQTAGISYELLHTELTLHWRDGQFTAFNDGKVHEILLRSGIKRKDFKGAKEWFVCSLETAKEAIKAAKEDKTSLSGVVLPEGHEPIILRPEQRQAVDKTKKRFRQGKRMLWDAKMRFGKTITALSLIKELGYDKTIILTHRPVVDEGWFTDYNRVFYHAPQYHYGSHNRGETFATLERARAGGAKYIYFASMQDLRGSQEVGGKYDKNNEVFSTTWDLVIVDEAHEGTQTDLGQAVINKLIEPKTTKLLNLSGTPFNLLADYKEDEVFTWDYIMEQKAKTEWDLYHLGEPNPYASLPAISIYTYDLGALLNAYGDEEYAFNFKEFFRTDGDGVFVHEQDIDRFLNLLTDKNESCYPFSNDEFRRLFRHTLWILPGVKAAKALSLKLSEHPVFGAFRIVNVAGDGDQEEETRDALLRVNKAIGPDPSESYTITLSCGRLTTGVTVGAWTGVLMLSGGFKTSSASYMQTIFRVQSPFVHKGLMKTDCYAFDFAPDRSLRVLAETTRISTKPGAQTDVDRQVMRDFLNYCPVISIEGSRMKPYNEGQIFAQLKKVFIERVVRGGFEDGALYNDELWRLEDVDIHEFNKLKAIIGQTKAMQETSDIVINKQGLDKEEHDKPVRDEIIDKPTLDELERRRREEHKRKAEQRRSAISILRGISIRMPMLIYGAEIIDEDKELSIDNFTHLVDNKSWEEFMPPGVTKALFNKFKHYYDPDIFRESGKRIRQIARSADALSIEERIEQLTTLFSYFRNPDKETVLTPWRVVNMHMGESLGGYVFMDEAYGESLSKPRYVEIEGVTEQLFHPKSVIMEINSKSGLYPLYVAYSIYRVRVKEIEHSGGLVNDSFAQYLWKTTLEENILVVCKTPMAVSITKRTLAGFREIDVHAMYYPNIIKNVVENPDAVVNTLRDGKRFWKLNLKDYMKIDAVVGNPPYQVMVDGNGRAKPVYHLFMDLANRLSSRASLITPARYLFDVGFTPSEWNNKMLNDPHFRVVWYKANSLDVFPNVDIKGGVAVTYRDTNQQFGAIGTFKAYPELSSISYKVEIRGDRSLMEIIYAESSYKFDTSKPEVEELVRTRLGNDKKIITNIFEKLPDIFTREPQEGTIGIFGRSKEGRGMRYASRSLFEAHPGLDKYKVFVPEANGSGSIGEVLSTPLVGEPLVGSTQSFLSIGAFDTEAEAAACLKYIKTRFARTMLGILKVTQHNPRETWRLVPLQDFTSASDIDWSLSVEEIDEYLFEKYKLDMHEIAFIKEKVKAML